MVQRKVPNKLGIKPKPKPNHLKSDTQFETQNLKKIMKKPSPPFTNKKKLPPATQSSLEKQSPNYMKSTTSFDARKERSPSVNSPISSISNKTPSPKKSDTSKSYSSSSGHKVLRTLKNSPSFKPLRSSKKCSSVMLCEDLDAHRATCSSTLKESKFPSYLQLSPGGTELNGTSEMKVCPYTYCSLNGHHHAPVPPLKSFLSARRRAMKTQKSFKLGCLSPRQTKPKPVVRKKKETENEQVAAEVKGIEEESLDSFIEIYGKKEENKGGHDSGCSEIDLEEGYGSASCLEDEQTLKMDPESLYGRFEELYDEESVSSGAWLEEDGDYESDGSCQQMKIDHQSKDQTFLNHDGFEVPSRTIEEDMNDEMDDKIVSVCKNAIFEAKNDELKGLNLVPGDHDIKCSIDYKEETCQESKSVPDSEGNSQKQHTIIYNIIQLNISVFINGVKTEDSKTEKGVVQVPASVVAADEKVSASVEEHIMSNEGDDENKLTVCEEVSDLNQIVEDSKKECNEYEDKDSNTDMKKNRSLSEEGFSSEDLPDEAKNLRGCKKVDRDMEDLGDFNPRGPNFLPEVVDPDAETVDLRHQMMDERKNSEEWMVDFALQQAVTTLAPERKRKVALLVEAFEKVMPIPKYETYNSRAPKAFTNARPMQACS